MYAFWYFFMDSMLARQIVASWAHLSNTRQRPVGFYYQGIITLTRRVKPLLRNIPGAVGSTVRHSLGTRARLQILVKSIVSTLVKRTLRTLMNHSTTKFPLMGEGYNRQHVTSCLQTEWHSVDCDLSGYATKLCDTVTNERISEQPRSLCTNDNVHSRWVPHRTGRTYCR